MLNLSKLRLWLKSRWALFSLITYGLWLAVLVCVTCVSSLLLLQSARHRDFAGISKYSTQAQTTLQLLDFSTLSLIPDLDFLHQAVSIPAHNYPFLFWLEQLSVDPFLPTESPLSSKVVLELTQQLSALNDSCTQTWLIRWLDHGSLCTKLSRAATTQQALTPFITNHLEQDHTYIILFQNSEELRASGGFMGSFAKMVIGAQGLSYLEIQDIYEPDGQFKGFVPAPPGVAEYLSSGNGLRLPDANWAADFPTAAQTILNYFSFGDHQSVDGLVAINSTLIKKLLLITGDIYLPDYKTNVSAETFSTLARANREEFFPGSKQKQHFLSSFMTQLKLRLTELSPTQQQALIALLQSSVASKDILVYSTNEELQTALTRYQLTGSLNLPSASNLIYLVESNVGINKANKNVTRKVTLKVEPNTTELTIEFANQNQAADYANYQRLIVPASWKVETISLNQQPVTTWSELVLNQETPVPLKQVGFLVGVPSSQTATLTLTLAAPLDLATSESSRLLLVKQPGLSPTPYQITWQGQTTNYLLDQDMLLPLPL